MRALDPAAADRLLVRLFEREDKWSHEDFPPDWDVDTPLSPRLYRLNSMIIRAVDWVHNPRR